ncbi:NEDD4-binding protein 2-like isoform X4 [Pocillopora damicornis]|uniref:NEDD4-binding protein 2-like isoform X4 n=1 Tax=Pocillopora damicornis TaxID=46731 RepID=UPI000F5558EA|nr:NEDD4-binding protein 2-like isoform X4 [Pocillopora damicornis]
MPRRRNQSPDAPSSGKDSTEKVPKDNDVQLRWRENTLFELQNMFSGSIDPGVVQLVLSESDYNVNDAVEKLFVLSGIEQGQTESQAIPDSRPSKSSLENQKPNYQHGISNAGREAHKVDSQFKGIQAGASSDNSSSSVIKSSFTQTSKGKIALLSQYSTSDSHHQGEVPRSLPHYKPTSGVSYGADRTVSPEGVLLHVGTDNTSSVTSSGLPDFPDYVALQFNTLTNQANTPYAELLSSQKPTIHQRDMQSEDLEPPAGPDHCEHSKPKTINLPIHDQELKGNLESYNKQVISGSSSTEQTKKIPLGCSEKKPLDFEFSRKEQQVESSSTTDRSDNTNPRVSCNEGQRTSNDHNCNYNHLNFYQNTSKTSLKHNDDTPQLQHRTNTVQQLQLHHNENSKSKETMSQPPAIQRQIYPYLRPQGFSQTSNVSQQRFPIMPVVPAVWHPGLLTQRFPGHVPTQYLQGPLSTNPCFSFGAPCMAAVTRPVRHGFGVRGSMSPPTKQKVLILMRGLPGSGKTFLAQKLKGRDGVVLSTDDYFYRNQRYKFDASSLGEAHEWNQSRAKTAMESQQSPLIIDNTNTQSWEMKPYISMAVKYGYHIKIVEPNTPWKWDVKELVRRNQHGVTYAAITRMKERYEHNLSVETLKKSERHTDARKTEDELETKKCVDEEQENDERACETCTGEASKEVHITSMVNCDEYLESGKSLPLKNILDGDAILRGENDAQIGEPSESKYFPTPPPLSEILASASRTRSKSRPKSTSEPLQLVTDNASPLQENGNHLYSEPNLTEKALEHEVCDGNPDPKDRTFDEDVSTSKQSQSNLPYLLNPLQPSSSENSQNQRHAGLEFLKTCFPDVDCDLMNAILTAKGGDLTKVVDELLMRSKAPSAELSTFPADSLYFASQQEIFDSPSRVAQKSSSPTEETVNAASAPQTQSNVGGENNKLAGELSSQMYLAPKVSSQAQSPRSNTTFQLTLEPAVALHLIELFGPFAGVDFQDNISREDLVIAVDCSLARQLYKKWEHTIQTRKGIPVAGLGCKQRAKGKPTVNNQLDRDQIPDIQQSTPRFPTEPQATGTLREIMDEQLAVELSRNLPNVTEQDMATKLKKQKLFEMFPGVDPVALEEVFQANGFELAPSVEAVKASCNLSGQDAPTTVIASGFSGRFVDKKATKEERAEDWSWLDLDVPSRPNSDVSSFQTLEDPSYLDYRAEAFQHYNLRDECFKKAALAFSKKQGQLAQFYAQQGHLHTEKIKEANARAAALILDQKNELTDDNTIDLHGLHVTEAIEALENMLSERIDSCSSLARKGCKFLNVVTGRGNHSRGGKARIKPAIIEYLKKHNYRFTEPHPGLVKVFL